MAGLVDLFWGWHGGWDRRVSGGYPLVRGCYRQLCSQIVEDEEHEAAGAEHHGDEESQVCDVNWSIEATERYSCADSVTGEDFFQNHQNLADG